MVTSRIPPFLLLAASLTVASSTAGAQSRGVVESAPLLPPGSLPAPATGSAQPYPAQSYPPQSYPPQQGYPAQSAPGRTYPQQPPPGAPRPGATPPGQLNAPAGGGTIQSAPLPPAGAAAPAGVAAPAPAVTPAPSTPAAPAPNAAGGDVTVVKPPPEKIVNPTAVFAGLDKITGRITSFEVAMGETVQFGALQITPRACYTRPPTETTNTTAFAEVNEITLKGEAKRIFTGWMFASSPGLHGVEHPIYDVWLMDCKATAPNTARSAGQK